MPGKLRARARARLPADVLRLPQATTAADSAPAVQRLSRRERQLLDRLQRDALRYFLDNQLSHGFVLDRQRNHGTRSTSGLCSTSATGMGLMAVALAAAPEYRMLVPEEARTRVQTCLRTVLERLPCDHGMVPHFLDARTLEPVGVDRISTVDSSWLAAGALWAGSLLDCPNLQTLADRLYRRIDWRFWAAGEPCWFRHGKGSDGQFLPHTWDRLNAETAFMYALGIGADAHAALSSDCWTELQPRYGCVAGERFASADLGLFVFQYSLELLDFRSYYVPGALDLYEEARVATRANYQACKAAAAQFRTYRHFWGLSAGDGPGRDGDEDTYRCYSPLDGTDGTAHVTATLASLSTWPALVLENIEAAQKERRHVIHGRYGYSNINLDCDWVSRDMVGIDLGAAVLALDNFLHHGRIRRVFHGLDCVRQALERLAARRRPVLPPDPEWRQAA